jgi:hypothetical protein
MKTKTPLLLVLWCVVLVGVAGLWQRSPSSPSTVGCTKAQEQAVVSTLPPLGACIVQAAASDFVAALSDPLSLVPAIVSMCGQYGEVTAGVILSVVESWFAAAPAVDAGPSPSDAGAPSLVATRLRRVHDLLKPAVRP